MTLEAYASADAMEGDDLVAATEIFNACWDEWVPGERPMSPDAYADQERSVPATKVLHRVLARDDRGRLVGLGDVSWAQRPAEGASTAHVMVAPAARNLGAGGALARHVVEQARAAGRHAVTFELAVATVGEALCERAGLHGDLVVEINRTSPSAVTYGFLRDWVATGEAAEGYSLVTYDDRCPDDLVEAAVAARLAMNDAPQYEGHADDELTVEDLRAAEVASVAANQSWWGVAVRHDATGEVAGLSDLFLPRRRPWIAFQGDTCVVAAHRGHGLGAWMKAINHLRLRHERPEVEVVSTWNAASNEPMLRINRALGFQPAGRFRGWYLALE
jgi:GNAT superfamily N-acetyltransferase